MTGHDSHYHLYDTHYRQNKGREYDLLDIFIRTFFMGKEINRNQRQEKGYKHGVEELLNCQRVIGINRPVNRGHHSCIKNSQIRYPGMKKANVFFNHSMNNEKEEQHKKAKAIGTDIRDALAEISFGYKIIQYW